MGAGSTSPVVVSSLPPEVAPVVVSLLLSLDPPLELVASVVGGVVPMSVLVVSGSACVVPSVSPTSAVEPLQATSEQNDITAAAWMNRNRMVASVDEHASVIDAGQRHAGQTHDGAG
jgi:hypothetical protein